jgi:hypothetical protein
MQKARTVAESFTIADRLGLPLSLEQRSAPLSSRTVSNSAIAAQPCRTQRPVNPARRFFRLDPAARYLARRRARDLTFRFALAR